MNRQILGVLVEDFYESVSEWASERKKKGRKEEELGDLIESLGNLFAKSQKLSSWNDHINNGNLHLKKAASNMVLTGVLMCFAIMVLAFLLDSDASLGILLAFFIGYGGLIFLVRGVGEWREYCRIESRIDKSYSDLTFGKSNIIERNEEEDVKSIDSRR